MTAHGAYVVGIDISQAFIQRARQRTGSNDYIQYSIIDATDKTALVALGVGRFDKAVCTMGFMDMVAIEPLLKALTVVLKPGGKFVFTVTHSVFNSNYTRMFAERETKDGRVTMTTGVKLAEYLTLTADKGEGVVGQPKPQYYFHRPVSALLNACFKVGFVMTGIEEPVLPPEQPSRLQISYSSMPSIPPILGVRMELPSG